MKDELLHQLIEYAGDDCSQEQRFFMRMLIEDAIDEVTNIMYPYGFASDAEEKLTKEKAMKRYKSKIRKIAQYHYDKQGREGVTGWSENGSSVSYEDAGTPSSYLKGIITIAKIV